MRNLLDETREAIGGSGHTPNDIVFIGSRISGHRCTWAEFESMADFDYDNGYGGQEIAADLEVVFSDGQAMHRGEYDGSEWWEFSVLFVEPAESKPITRLKTGYWSPLASADEDQAATS